MFLETLTQTINGWTVFNFTHPASRYKIKNFTSSDIFISFTPKSGSDSTNGCPKLPKDYCDELDVKIWTDISSTPILSDYMNAKTDTVYIYGTGEVEVSQL